MLLTGLFTGCYLVILKPLDFFFFLLFGSIFMLFMYRLLSWLFIHVFTVDSSSCIRFPDNWATRVSLHLLYFFVFVHYVCVFFTMCFLEGWWWNKEKLGVWKAAGDSVSLVSAFGIDQPNEAANQILSRSLCLPPPPPPFWNQHTFILEIYFPKLLLLTSDCASDYYYFFLFLARHYSFCRDQKVTLFHFGYISIIDVPQSCCI